LIALELGPVLKWVERYFIAEMRGELFFAERIRKSAKAMILGEPSLEDFSMNRHGLGGDKFARIKKLLPGRAEHVGRDRNWVIGSSSTGVPWRDMPVRFAASKNIHTRFSRWAKKGIGRSPFKAVADYPDNEYAVIDATIVRAHQDSAGARKKGRR
jgi:transposase